MTAQFIIAPLDKAHNRSGFACGNDRIDTYFHKVVSQDVKRSYASCFVASEVGTNRVAGFYTLSSTNVNLSDVPESLAKKLPRYPTVPAVLIGWLARHKSFAGIGLGDVLLFNAIRRITELEIGIHAIIADAIDKQAAEFYQNFGFNRLSTRKLSFYLPVATAKKLIHSN